MFCNTAKSIAFLLINILANLYR